MSGSVTVTLADLLGRALAGFPFQALGMLTTCRLDTGMTRSVAMAFTDLLRRAVPW
jgi:hypothetical protein